MGTFTTLLEARTLIRVTIPLPRGQFDERKFYAFPSCFEWMRNEVPKMATGRIASALTPKEQLIERLFHDMEPRSDQVWEMKTHDLRLFGWMYRPREFIAVCGGYADHYKEPTKIKSYADNRRKVVLARNALSLDGEKHATGDFDELV